eukprot:gene14681-17358_t
MKILKQDTPFDRIKKNAKKKFKALKIDILKKDISYLCPPNILNEFTAEIRSMDALSKYNSHYDFLKNFEDTILKNVKSNWFNSESIYFQDLTRLSYPDNHFDLSLTFEDLEHIPNYKLALAELFRVTKHGGAVLLSAPFATNSQQNIIRAKLSDKGEIVHLMKPEYHGDPLKEAEGILCFQHFGWDFLDELRDAGFSDVSGSNPLPGIFAYDQVIEYLNIQQLCTLLKFPCKSHVRFARPQFFNDEPPYSGRSAYDLSPLVLLGINQDYNRLSTLQRPSFYQQANTDQSVKRTGRR